MCRRRDDAGHEQLAGTGEPVGAVEPTQPCGDLGPHGLAGRVVERCQHLVQRPERLALEPHAVGCGRESHRRRDRADRHIGEPGVDEGGLELAGAAQAGRQLVRLAPLRESGYRHLMGALAAQGNVAEALPVYSELCATRRDQLGISPSPESRAFYDELLRTTA